MAHFKPPAMDHRTLCELQCQLVNTPCAATGTLSGPTCPDIDLTAAAATTTVHAVKCPNGQWPPSYTADDDDEACDGGRPRRGGLRPLLRHLRRLPPAARLERLLLGGVQPGSLPEQATLAWHPSQALLAALDDSNRIQLYNYSGQLPLLGQGRGGRPPLLQPTQVLQHELQQQASAAAWRPFGGQCLVVGVAHGACLWHIGRPPAGGALRSDSGAWLTWLKAPSPGPVTALAWHPQGHLLAGATPQSQAGFHVWDVATGTATPVSAGREAVSLLRWSPCGSYLLAAHPAGAFTIWQTQAWWSQRWVAAAAGGGGGGGGGGSGEVVEACWGADSRSLVLAYSNSPQLVCLHFTQDPPSLQAQLLPLPLPELDGKGGSLVQALAWDPRAQRLAVAVGSAHPAAGCVALYDTRCDPILSARFIGFMRLGPLGEAAPGGGTAGGAGGEAGWDWDVIQADEAAEASAAVRGSTSQAKTGKPDDAAAAAAGAQRSGLGSGPGAGGPAGAGAGKRPQLAFLPSFAQGAVLAARTGNHIAAVPLYFAA
ncbi:Aladin [Chlorella vulgaris]